MANTRSGVRTPRDKRQLNISITAETGAILRAVYERDGVPYSAQVERAMRLWAIEKDIEVPNVTATRKGA